MTPSYSSDGAEDTFSNQLVILNDEVNEKSSTEESKSERFAFLDNYLKKIIEIGTTLVDFRLKSQSESFESSAKSDITSTVSFPERVLKSNVNKCDDNGLINENNTKKPPNQGAIKKQYTSTLTKKLLLNDEFLNRLYLSSEIERENALNDMFDNMVMNNFIVEYSREGHIKESNDRKSKSKVLETNSQDRLENYNKIKEKNRKNILIKKNINIDNLTAGSRSVNADPYLEREKSHGDVNLIDSTNENDLRINRLLLGAEIDHQLNEVVEKSIANVTAMHRKIKTKESDIIIDYDKISDVLEASIKSVLPLKKSEKFIKKKLRKIENQLNEVKSFFKFPDHLFLEHASEFKGTNPTTSNKKNEANNYCEISIENQDLKCFGIFKNINSTNVTNSIDLIVPFPERSSLVDNEKIRNPFCTRSSDEKTPPTISIDYSPPESEIRIEMVRTENNFDNKQLSSVKKGFDSINRKLSNENIPLYKYDIKGNKSQFRESDLLRLNSYSADNPIEIRADSSCHGKTLGSSKISKKKSNNEIVLENIEKNLESICYKVILEKAVELSQQLIDAIDIKSKKNKLEMELNKVLSRESFVEVSLSNNKINTAKPLSSASDKKTSKLFECEILKSERKVAKSNLSEFNENATGTYLLVDEQIVAISNASERLPEPSIYNKNKSLNNSKAENISQKLSLYGKPKNSSEDNDIINKREFYIEDEECAGERYIPSNALQFTVEIESFSDENFSNQITNSCKCIYQKSILNEKRKMTKKSFKSNIHKQSSLDKSSTIIIDSEKEK